MNKALGQQTQRVYEIFDPESMTMFGIMSDEHAAIEACLQYKDRYPQVQIRGFDDYPVEYIDARVHHVLELAERAAVTDSEKAAVKFCREYFLFDPEADIDD